jgi:hypothetical protein
MAFFRVGAIIVEIQSRGASLTRERIGPTFVTYAGSIRSQVRGTRRIWQGDTPPLLFADADALVAEIGVGLTTLGGDWVAGLDIEDTFAVYMEVLNDVPVKDPSTGALDARRVLTLKAQEMLIS